jgi:hypothetical protein
LTGFARFLQWVLVTVKTMPVAEPNIQESGGDAAGRQLSAFNARMGLAL